MAGAFNYDWRIDLDALVFSHPASGSRCFVHRLAFRALTKNASPTAQDCMRWFVGHRAAFEAAADEKAGRGPVPGNAFNLNSREIRRALRMLRAS
ncbi:hypothetical protein [Ciceribacter sp. RN22]|uniref:hypothetical protein n=1 Tax=Ciceribacter sp. RN22 TaxID=2954932 RepID=UPI002093C80D|nr:hypothetical protein [Ciceribacter sp. RN22]MCO6177520.1 hypothetical protein [Ciceribacter sp. RN22]